MGISVSSVGRLPDVELGRLELLGSGSESGLKLGEAIRMGREASGLTQKELATLIGYSHGWISGVERGVVVASRDMVCKIDNTLGEGEGEGKDKSEGSLVKLGESLGVWSGKWKTYKKGYVGDWGMTITEAGQYLGISRTNMYGMVRRGEIPWVRVDNWKRLRIKDVAKYVVENSEERPLLEVEADIREWLKGVRS